MKKTILFCLLMTLSAFMIAGEAVQGFTIDLTQATPALPDGVTQVSYPQNAASYHGNQHGWCWFAFKFNATGPVRITLGGCQYINAGSEGYVEAAGTKVGDIPNKTAACYDADPANNVATFDYKGEAAELIVYCGQYCPFVQVEPVVVPTVKEEKIYFTNFQDWDDVASSTTASTKTVTTKKSNEELTFTFAETQISSTGTNAKFTNTEVITAGYAMAAKTATPYIETSALASITKVTYVHAATGGSRGWGLEVKGDGDADWVKVQENFCAQAGTLVSVDINRTNCQLRWYNLNASNNAYMTELAIYGNVAVKPRTFKNFELNFMNISELPAVPEGVTSMSGAPRNDSHGLDNFQMLLDVDGPVKFTLGGCEYNNGVKAIVKNGETVLAELDVTTPKCYHNGGKTEWTYNAEEPATLTIKGAQYTPYIKAEACEYVENVVVTYFDQNSTKLGEESVLPGTAFVPLFTEEALPAIPEGSAFRGWYTADNYKAPATITTDIKLYAKVTPVETAVVGSHYKYDLTKAYFYAEDHELITATGKQHGSGHGYVFNNGEEMTLVVSPKAYVSVGLCTYTNTSDQIIRNAAGDSVSVMHVIKNGEEGATADGALCSFYYANPEGKQDTLHFNFATTSYIHSVEVYNVANQLNKTGHVYDIPAGDAAALMLVCSQLQDGDTVLLHDGVYDLGEVVLTTVSANNIVIKGESMEGTIIRNAPDAKNEGISTTATILNTGTGNIFENLTLQNALDYYKADNGRAVCLQDKGTRTACYRVRMLSYQDTYYSNKPGQQCWFEDCEIHGTVDFICGSGSVYFYNTLLYCEKRAKAGGGQDCITANNSQTAQQDKGYVFDRCTIVSECPVVSLSRSWNDQPQVAYLLTTLDMSKGEFGLNDSKIQRWTIEGMNNCLPYDFAEYSTMDTDGNVISPESNKVQFFGKVENEMETIIGYEAAEAKSYTHFFRDGWKPARNYVPFPESLVNGVSNRIVAGQQPVKVLRNGNIYILHAGVVYDILGNVVSE